MSHSNALMFQRTSYVLVNQFLLGWGGGGGGGGAGAGGGGGAMAFC